MLRIKRELIHFLKLSNCSDQFLKILKRFLKDLQPHVN